MADASLFISSMEWAIGFYCFCHGGVYKHKSSILCSSWFFFVYILGKWVDTCIHDTGWFLHTGRYPHQHLDPGDFARRNSCQRMVLQCTSITWEKDQSLEIWYCKYTCTQQQLWNKLTSDVSHYAQQQQELDWVKLLPSHEAPSPGLTVEYESRYPFYWRHRSRSLRDLSLASSDDPIEEYSVFNDPSLLEPSLYWTPLTYPLCHTITS